MMRKKLIHLVLILTVSLLAFTSCDNREPVNKVVIENEYSMELPTAMTQIDDLNPEATLSYGSDSLRYYIVVIESPGKYFYENYDRFNVDENHTRDLKGFMDIFIENLEVDANIRFVSDYKNSTIDGNQAIETTFVNQMGNLYLFYHLTIVETEEKFYKIMQWTTHKNKDEILPKMEMVSKTFRIEK